MKNCFQTQYRVAGIVKWLVVRHAKRRRLSVVCGTYKQMVTPGWFLAVKCLQCDLVLLPVLKVSSNIPCHQWFASDSRTKQCRALLIFFWEIHYVTWVLMMTNRVRNAGETSSSHGDCNALFVGFRWDCFDCSWTDYEPVSNNFWTKKNIAFHLSFWYLNAGCACRNKHPWNGNTVELSPSIFRSKLVYICRYKHSRQLVKQSFL